MPSQKPGWFRLDHDFLRNPKLARLRGARKHAAIYLWMEGLGYANRHLTDGWVPPTLPRDLGYRSADAEDLVAEGLWHPMQISDIGGWIIHDFFDHQPTREWWEKRAAQRSAAARARWDARS